MCEKSLRRTLHPIDTNSIQPFTAPSVRCMMCILRALSHTNLYHARDALQGVELLSRDSDELKANSTPRHQSFALRFT